jgi:hypothetical protein
MSTSGIGDLLFLGAWLLFVGAVVGVPAGVFLGWIVKRLFGVELAFRRAWALAAANVFAVTFLAACFEQFGSGVIDAFSAPLGYVPFGTIIYAFGVRRSDGMVRRWWRGFVLALLPPVLVFGFFFVVAFCVTHGIGGKM